MYNSMLVLRDGSTSTNKYMKVKKIMGYCKQYFSQKGYAIYTRFNRSTISLFLNFFGDKI